MHDSAAPGTRAEIYPSIVRLPIPSGWLELRAGIRKRAAMFIGDTGDRGLHMLVVELLINALDQLASHDHPEIWITLHPDNQVTVADNGPGFANTPVDTHGEPRPLLEAALTRDFLRGKTNGPEVVSTGPHGIGLCVVHAVSSRLSVETVHRHRLFTIASRDGLLSHSLLDLGPAQTSGTAITFTPDMSLFQPSDMTFDAGRIAATCNRYAFLYAGLRFLIIDRRTGERISIHHPGGIADWALDLAGPALAASPFFLPRTLVHTTPRGPVSVALAIAPTSNSKPECRSYANAMETPDGGSHEEALHDALTRRFKSKTSPLPPSFRQGLITLLQIWHPDLTWEGCIKSTINVPGLRQCLATFLRPHLAQIHPSAGWGQSSPIAKHHASPARTTWQQKVLK